MQPDFEEAIQRVIETLTVQEDPALDRRPSVVGETVLSGDEVVFYEAEQILPMPSTAIESALSVPPTGDGKQVDPETFARLLEESLVKAAPTRRSAPGPVEAGLLHLVAMLLPEQDRQRWLEEWAGELYDLRAEGAPWWRLAAHVLDILRGAPRQAISLRRHRRRATE